MDTKSLVKSELIGKHVTVLGKKAKAGQEKELKELCRGIVVDETKNLLVIEDDYGKRKKIIKSNFRFCFDESSLNICGQSIVGRPEDRIKSKVKNERIQ